MKKFLLKEVIKLNNSQLQKEIERGLKQELYNAGLYLKKCILNQMKKTLLDNPKVYKRTGNLEKSLQIDNIMNIKVIDNRLQIRLYFDEKAWHKSGNQIKGWNGDGREINVAYYLNYGYKTKKDVWFKNIRNFGYRKETLYIEKGIDVFNATNKWNMFIDKEKDIIVSSRSDFIR